MTMDKDFLKKLLIIGIPVVIQNLISIGLNLIDTLMIGQLGEQPLAAVGAANQLYFVFMVSLFGLLAGASVYMSQYFGARDFAGIKRVLGIDYAVGILWSLGFFLIAQSLGAQVIHIFSKDPEVIAFGVQYLRIASISYVVSGIAMVISYNSRAIQMLNVATAIAGIALAINATLNYVLIFGKFGAPALGVEGAAIATLIARIFEAVALLAYVYMKKDHPFRANLAELRDFDAGLFKDVMKMASPVLLTEGSWAFSVSLTYAAFGMLGTSALAVSQIANVVCDLLQSVYFGVGNATAMLIGEKLGQKNVDKAYQYGRWSLWIVMGLNVVMTLIMLALARPVAGIYHFSGETHALLVASLMAMAFTITPKMLGYQPIAGILRGGGDTFFCMVIELTANFVFVVPMAYIAVLVLKVSLPVAMILIEVGDLFRMITTIPRFHSRKWINLVT